MLHAEKHVHVTAVCVYVCARPVYTSHACCDKFEHVQRNLSQMTFLLFLLLWNRIVFVWAWCGGELCDDESYVEVRGGGC